MKLGDLEIRATTITFPITVTSRLGTSGSTDLAGLFVHIRFVFDVFIVFLSVILKFFYLVLFVNKSVLIFRQVLVALNLFWRTRDESI